MKKNFKYYLISWAVILALFNVITFIVPSFPTTQKYNASFWIGYVFITLMLIGHPICAYFAFKGDNAQKLFYNISLIKASYTSLIASFVIGGLCMLISPLPYWIAVVLCAVILAVNVLAIMKATVAVNEVNNIDEKIKTQTFFIKSITADADSLTARASSESMKAECKKVYEALRYSDVMSCEALADIEKEITVTFSEFSDAVKADCYERATELTKELLILINDRNTKCKLLK